MARVPHITGNCIAFIVPMYYVYTHYVWSYLLYHKILIDTTSDGGWKQYQ